MQKHGVHLKNYMKLVKKRIGVSNLPHHLDTLAKTAKVMPMVNQIFLAPGELQPEVVDYAKKHDIDLRGLQPTRNWENFRCS